MTTPARDEALRDRVARAIGGIEGDDLSDLPVIARDSCYRAADAVLGVLADSRAEAWDEGYDARGVDIANEGLTETTLTPNPYRKEATDG